MPERGVRQVLYEFLEWVRPLRHRDWLPLVAAVGLGLSVGDHFVAWILAKMPLDSALLASWQDASAFHWSSRILSASVFLFILIVLKRFL